MKTGASFRAWLIACSLVVAASCGRQKNPDIPSGTPSVAPADPRPDQVATILAELTQAVRRYALEQQRVPKTLDELVANGYLTQVPLPPSGKRFAISKKLEVYLTGR